jgi:hypothetical protein
MIIKVIPLIISLSMNQLHTCWVALQQVINKRDDNDNRCWGTGKAKSRHTLDECCYQLGRQKTGGIGYVLINEIASSLRFVIFDIIDF